MAHHVAEHCRRYWSSATSEFGVSWAQECTRPPGDVLDVVPERLWVDAALARAGGGLLRLQDQMNERHQSKMLSICFRCTTKT
jgi:hypothetical protein